MITNTFSFIKTLSPGKNRNLFFYLVYTILFLWCINSILWPQNDLFVYPVGGLQSVAAQIICLKILLAVFAFLSRDISSRVTTLLLGCIGLLICGKMIGFYDLNVAFQRINISTISLLFGMSIISIILAETNIFRQISYSLIQKFGGNYWALFIVLCLFTYVLSLVINNLTTMLLLIPLTLTLTDNLKINSIPFIIGEIVASNLGGASSMIGDFPNMLISSKMQIPFQPFIKYLMPICLINLAVMFIYFYYKVDFKIRHQFKDKDKFDITLPPIKIEHRPALVLSLIVLHTIFILLMMPSINPGLMVLLASLFLFLASGIDKDTIIKKVRYEDLAFFMLLFIFVGGIEASGLLQTVVHLTSYVSFHNPLLQLIILMWVACLITMFFNAGPTTALFIPMFLHLSLPESNNNLIWWGLSLGVCAGSSGALNGATAGPVACTLFERFYKNNKINRKEKKFLDWKNYSQIGLPIMYLHLMISTIYIIILFLLRRGT